MSSLGNAQILFFLIFLAWANSTFASRREILPPLEIRLAAAGVNEVDSEGIVGCLQAMMELKSCTSEIVLFFINGESYLTLECCRAIRLITHSCWPVMFSAVGFTSQEADILRGYCDAENATTPPSGCALKQDAAIPPSADGV